MVFHKLKGAISISYTPRARLLSDKEQFTHSLAHTMHAFTSRGMDNLVGHICPMGVAMGIFNFYIAPM